ncbi:hypothetical protein OH492_16365 [Vibrio chagasii]|nr:hypothetical protein [Vibrio chagasii]
MLYCVWIPRGRPTVPLGGNGLGWKLSGFDESDVDLQTARVQKTAQLVNISPFTGEDKSVARRGDLVVVSLENDIPINDECMFQSRTNPSCNPSLSLTK